MINPQELRKGNFISFDEDATIFKVLTIEDGGMPVESADEETWIEYDQFSPIELTPEILEKAGFAKFDIGGYAPAWRWKLNNFEITFDEYEGFWYFAYFSNTKNQHGYRVKYAIKYRYLHQLQNLYFALTGEELKIEL